MVRNHGPRDPDGDAGGRGGRAPRSVGAESIVVLRGDKTHQKLTGNNYFTVGCIPKENPLEGLLGSLRLDLSSSC